MRNIADKSRRENQNTHFVFNNIFSENRVVYENLENTVERSRPQLTIWRMRIACWIPTATNTQLQFVIRFAFPLLQRLNDRASTFCYTYIVCPF